MCCKCEYKNIKLSRKGKKLYFGGVFLTFLTILSIPFPPPIVYYIYEQKKDELENIEKSIRYLHEQNKEW